MIETIYRRVLFIAWALFLGWVCCSQVAGQETWVGKRGNLFEGYASQTPLTKLDPVVKDLIHFRLESSVDSTGFSADVQAVLPYAVVVRNDLGGGRGAKGSGVYLGDGLYSSAWHVVADNPNGSITVTWKTGEKYKAFVVAKDTLFDIVILETYEKPRGGVPLADSAASIGNQLYLAGYSQGPLQAWTGRAVNFASPVGARTADWLDVTQQAISGDSGGPVFNENGFYIGPLWGSGGGTTCVSNAGRFQNVLGRLRDRVHNWHTQGFGCFGSQCPPGYGGGYVQPSNRGGGGGRVDVNQNPGTPVTPVQPPPQIPQQPPQQPVPSNGGCDCKKPQQPSGCDCENGSASGCDPAAIAKAIKDALGDLKGETGERGLQGPIGPQGPRGPQGEPGQPGQITDEQLALIAASVYQKMQTDPKFRGPAGSPGEITALQIEQIKAEVLASLPDLRVLLVDGSTGSVIDDETYKPGEPLVLDFQRVINAARQR